MSLTYKDIANRQLSLLSEVYTSTNINPEQVLTSLKENYSFDKAKLLLENWSSFGDEEIALDKVFEVFTIITDNDNESNIRNAANIIEGNIIKKLRNAKQTNALNHYKRGWIKHRHTSMLNDTKDNINAVSKAKSNGGYLGNSLHPHRKYKRDIYGRKMGEEVNNKKPSGEDEGKEDKNEQEIKECFDRFIQLADNNVQCDRVLSNHKKLTKRFNFDNIVRTCSITEQSLQECVYNICNLLETYDLSVGIRYLIALENTMYLMHKNCVPMDNQQILESVTDYFLMTENEQMDVTLGSMKYVIENSRFFTPDELNCVRYICGDYDDQLINLIESSDNMAIYEGKIDEKIHDMYLKWKAKHIDTLKKKQELESVKIKKAIHDFKKSNKKTIEKFEETISRIFVNSPEGIINELPDIFVFIRLAIYVGIFALKPLLGVLALITGYFLKMKVSRERMAKVVEQYSKERDNYKKKMKDAESSGDEKKKEKYKRLYEQYKSDTEKLEMYENELYTDAENDKRMEEKWAKEAESNMGDDFNFDFDFDDDFSFDENAALTYIYSISNICEQLSLTKANLEASIRNNIHKLSFDNIYNITEAVKECNDIIDCNRYISILQYELDRINSVKTESYIANRHRVNSIKSCISEINQVKFNTLLENYSFNDDDPINDAVTLYETLVIKNDILNDMIDYINEAKEDNSKGLSLISKIKIGVENMKRVALKAKDKDKQLSMKLDSEIDRVTKAAKKSMISDSRESIIKGSFLPSASKCIHIALASGAAWIVNPVLAVIGLIGYIGCSKSLTEKERNLILDDIDIELKMCDKYLKIAEDKDDLVAVREIMKTKRDLERQRSRILYNKNYVFKGKKQYDMKPANKEED